MRWFPIAIASLSAVVALPATAQERDYCPARPGLGTPACTIAPGRVSVETALADWTLERDADSRTDTILIADTLVRIGLSDSVEAQLGWTPFGHVRARDASGVDRANRVGDAYLGMKANLMNPDGGGLSVAVQPFVKVPVGRSPVGAGDWGAGMLAPVTYDLSETLNLEFTPELDAAVDEDGHGRHVAFGGTIGLAAAFTDTLTGTAEFQELRDVDLSGHSTQALGGLSMAWMRGAAFEIDAGANAGLNHAAPDIELYLGVSRRF